MNGTFVIGGPEALLIFGVHVKILSALFGVIGVVVGHVAAPKAVEPLGWRRHAAVIMGGFMIALGVTIATGQRPLIVFGWSMGTGFAGITIFKVWAAQAAAATKSLGSAALDELSQRIAARKDKP
jgi:hypothetical protein